MSAKQHEQRISTWLALETKVDELERAIVEKVASLTGFGDREAKIRFLMRAFKREDAAGSGVLDYRGFFAALTQLHFFGVQREIENIFNRLDEYGLGAVDYAAFVYYLFDVGTTCRLSRAAIETLARLRRAAVRKDGVNGAWLLVRDLRRAAGDADTCDRPELLCRVLADLHAQGVAGDQIEQLVGCFRLRKTGEVDVKQLADGVLRGMTLARKRLVFQVFDELDANSSGRARVGDLLAAYQPSGPSGVYGTELKTAMSPAQLSAQLSQSDRDGSVVTWPEFLDVYRGVSVAFEDDREFEVFVRNSWSFPTAALGAGAAAKSSMGAGGSIPHVPMIITDPQWRPPAQQQLSARSPKEASSPRRMVLVTHTDGQEEIAEFNDVLGVTKFDADFLVRTLSSQGMDNISDIRL